uniref:Uncharacterized protein n=1 Tax=Helicotheca tamesis TaxID=374047 RepID=A0A7S2HJI8_9STRA|mmetsp:Transcript_18675/g.25742  ORF Transcript_18675/g.25742 Transcript_18675/m.25742 type:complete len:265 (+) Transcript_18675:332-1126(+)|eukprot:CAMPEP_0185724732 /NCGR_PEP_ID=MMETSP1171-20130828/1125_1 /TAXON_ID=374046 /ORGANISM="Helicotheca tamensis, Strain CCMP826" /LENGTH=264 /DNA_ID=CAMNT_0028392655 /DNA_START=289 /DNA_END=1083 /DNA_ORIENTATION=+
MASTKYELQEIERSAQGGRSAPPQAPAKEDDDMRRGSSLFASGGPAYEVPPSGGGGGGDLLVDFPGSKSSASHDDDDGGDELPPLRNSGTPANMSGPGRGTNGNQNAGYAQPPPGSFTGGRVPVGSGSSAMVNPTSIAAAAGPLGPPPSNKEETGDIRRNSVVLNPVAMGGLAGLIDFDDSDYEDSDDDGGRPGGPAGGPMPGNSSGFNPAASGGPDHRPMVGGFAAAAYEAAREYHYKNQGRQVRTSQMGSRSHGRPNAPSYP